MVFQEIGLERLVWINLWSLDGADCLIEARDGKIYSGLFGLVGTLERIGLWSDRRSAPIIVSLDCHLASFRCWQETFGEKNSIWLSGMAFDSCGHHNLSFRLLRF